MNQKFLKCEHCGNMVAVVKETGVPVMCCGEAMKEIVPGTVDASKEKHVITSNSLTNVVLGINLT